MFKEEVLLEIKNIYKEFNENVVLKGVDLTLWHGEVLALVGGNGAGKSTLMKILTGLYHSDRGTLKINGRELKFSNPSEAHRNGVYLIPQEPLIFPNMTIFENITIGLPGKKDHSSKISSILKELDWRISLDEIGRNLSIAQMQLVEIIRGIIREAEILIFDEPTSTLTFSEISALFEVIDRIKGRGAGIIYITHRLNEVFKIANTVAVLRDGAISRYGDVKEFTYNTLLEGLIPGITATESANHSTQEIKVKNIKPIVVNSHSILTVEGLSGKRFHDISFQLNSGEILGVAGVVGSGRTEIAEAIAGIEPTTSGKILLNGREIEKQTIRRRIRGGLAYVPEDRHLHGMFAMGSISMNSSSIVLGRLAKFFLPLKKEKILAHMQINNLSVKCTSENQIVQSLSGGNQQKIVLGKYLEAKPAVLILDEPTRGIDARARDDIYQTIRRLSKEGVGLIVISSDIEEITLLSDRVIVIHEGRIHAVLNQGEVTPDNVTSASFGIRKEVHL